MMRKLAMVMTMVMKKDKEMTRERTIMMSRGKRR